MRLRVLPVPNRIVTMDELGKVQLELVPVARSVGALHFTELALETSIHDTPRVEWRQPTNVAAVFLVDRGE